jgi:NAD(P)-dependent dehydrogenase (short-subunit alcohol dehydrogenase family)
MEIPMAKTVLITGASSGIGEAAARALVAKGHHVYAGVRNAADGERLARELGERCTPLTLDTTIPEQIAAAAQSIESSGLDALVNNAGIAVPGPLEFIPLDEFRRQFEVNVFGVVAVTQAMLPLLRKKRGRVINVGSIGGRNALPFAGAYTSSKHAIEALTQSLRMELAPFGLAVSLIEPGAVKTPIWQRSDALGETILSTASPEANTYYGDSIAAMRKFAAKTGAGGIAPEVVAAAIVHAVESARPKLRYTLGTDARAQLALKSIVPTRARERLLRYALTGKSG